MEFFDCVPLAAARELVAAAAARRRMPDEMVPLADALGRVLAQDMTAREDVPPFARSTVDGYAVRSADTFGAAASVPVTLAVAGEVLMGQVAPVALAPGQAVAVPTGGMLPPGADAVVMVENTESADEETVLVLRPVAPRENVIVPGEDMARGAVVLPAGRCLAPADIGALAACGYAQVPVRRRPVVAVLSTGDEIVDVGCDVTDGQVRDINGYAVAAALTAAGAMARREGIVPDNLAALQQAVAQALPTADMVVLSGGSSVGTRDQVAQVIETFPAARVLLHGVMVKPGKPVLCGLVGTVPVFGLPGHPVSALTMCELLVRPALAAMLGKTPAPPPRLSARISRNVASVPGRDDFIRVRLEAGPDGYRAVPIFGKSGLISTLAQADGVVHIAAAQGGLQQNDPVEVTLLR